MHDGEKGTLFITADVLDESPMLGYLSKNQKDKTLAKVYIYENEGPIPHCHIVGLGNQEICVRLDKPEYFSHGGKIGKFNSKERKLFNDFMHSKGKLGESRWFTAASMWNGYAEEDDTKIVITKNECPDYEKLQ